jgi:uncharacterized protein involved in exopolysaccharide biosynthesis
MRFRSRDRSANELDDNSQSPLAMPLPKIPDAPPLPEADAPIHGIFEPPSNFVLTAISRNKAIVALCAVALALVGIGTGLMRQATYESAATLQVGQVNPNSPGFFSYVQSSSSLATAFSRSVDAAPVLATIEQRLGLPAAKAVSRLSSEPIALSPAFRIIGKGPSAESTMRLTNVAAAAVIAYESHTNSADPEAAKLLQEYAAASTAARQAEEKIVALESGFSGDALLHAEAEKSAAQVKLKAIGGAYVAAIASQAPRVGLVSLLAGATSASSDRTAKVELFGFLGFLIGLALGCGVAVLRERRRLGRRHIGLGTEKLRSEPA